MKSHKALRYAARILVLCLLCVNCLGGVLAAQAATKVTSVLTAINDSASNVSSALYYGSGGLYLSEVYSIKDGKYIGLVKSTSYWRTLLATSGDRVKWELVGESGAFTYGNGKLLTYMGDTLAYSADGVDWKYIEFEGRIISKVWFEGGKFMMSFVYDDEDANRSVMVSDDGMTWYDIGQEWPENADINTFTIKDGNYYVFSSDSDGVLTGHYVSAISEKETKWNDVKLPDGARLFFIDDKGIGLIKPGSESNDYVNLYYTSTDGIRWEEKSDAYAGDRSTTEPLTRLHSLYDGTLEVKEVFYDNRGYANSLITIDGKQHTVQFTLDGELLEGSPYPYMPEGLLESVDDADSAVQAVNKVVGSLTPEQKASPAGIDLVTLFAEEAVAQAARQIVSGGDVTVSQSTVQSLQTKAAAARTAVEQALTSGGVATAREMSANVKFQASSSAVAITVEPFADAGASVQIVTPGYAVTLPPALMNELDGSLTITVTDADAQQAALMAGLGVGAELYAAYGDTGVSVSFSKPVRQNVKLSLQPLSGDPAYQAVLNAKSEAVGGKFNPVTGKLEAKINTSDVYTVKSNVKYFDDIEQKSAEMQSAIKILAAKGIINGTSATTFGPDGTITRAEVAALIVRTLSKLDANADGGFTDVVKSDWFFGAVGSAKRDGIINGISATAFAPKNNIQKDQIVAIAARTLKSEMKYKTPANTDGILSAYGDKSAIPAWGAADIALATKENLVVKRTDGNFNPGDTMTRGDAAVVLYRMFMKIW